MAPAAPKPSKAKSHLMTAGALGGYTNHRWQMDGERAYVYDGQVRYPNNHHDSLFYSIFVNYTRDTAPIHTPATYTDPHKALLVNISLNLVDIIELVRKQISLILVGVIEGVYRQMSVVLVPLYTK